MVHKLNSREDEVTRSNFKKVIVVNDFHNILNMHACMLTHVNTKKDVGGILWCEGNINIFLQMVMKVGQARSGLEHAYIRSV
jgi:hypothetical protein